MKIRQKSRSYEEEPLRIVFFFFIYVTDFQVRKTVRQIFFENAISHSFYWHGKLPLAAARVGNMF